jgi:hypothetical protein
LLNLLSSPGTSNIGRGELLGSFKSSTHNFLYFERQVLHYELVDVEIAATDPYFNAVVNLNITFFRPERIVAIAFSNEQHLES